MNFNPQPGDRVTIREWDDMAAEYGLNKSGEIKTPHIPILKNMKPYCGNSYTIKSVYRDSKGRLENVLFYDVWYYFPLCSLVDVLPSTQSLSPSPISFDSLLSPLTTF